MELAANFAFRPLDNDGGAAGPAAAPAAVAPDQGLGPLAGLAGNWSGQGFNAIWRPHRGASDHFLELNVTNDRIDLEVINGQIPNRGLVQAQIFMHGLTYLQQISDANVEVSGAPAGLHIEPGVWINIPLTTDPQEPATIARLASIPHGTTILVQGTATTAAGGPSIPAVSLTPFGIGPPHQTVDFDEQHLNRTTPFRTSGVGLTGTFVVAARYAAFDHRANVILYRIQLPRHVEVQVQTAMIHALQAENDFNLARLFPHPGEAGHAAHAHKSTTVPACSNWSSWSR